MSAVEDTTSYDHYLTFKDKPIEERLHEGLQSGPWFVQSYTRSEIGVLPVGMMDILDVDRDQAETVAQELDDLVVSLRSFDYLVSQDFTFHPARHENDAFIRVNYEARISQPRESEMGQAHLFTFYADQYTTDALQSLARWITRGFMIRHHIGTNQPEEVIWQVNRSDFNDDFTESDYAYVLRDIENVITVGGWLSLTRTRLSILSVVPGEPSHHWTIK